MVKTTFDKLRELTSFGAELSLLTLQGSEFCWYGYIRSERDGIKLEISARTAEFGPLIDELYSKFIQTTQFGAPALAAPIVESTHIAPPLADDEIPF